MLIGDAHEVDPPIYLSDQVKHMNRSKGLPGHTKTVLVTWVGVQYSVVVEIAGVHACRVSVIVSVHVVVFLPSLVFTSQDLWTSLSSSGFVQSAGGSVGGFGSPGGTGGIG